MTQPCDWVVALRAEQRAMPIDATWAKPVLVTAAELLALPDDAWRYELVEGKLVRMSPTGDRHTRTSARPFREADGFVILVPEARTVEV